MTGEQARKSAKNFSCLPQLAFCAMSVQAERWLRSVGGAFPARLWAEETAKAGCGESEMPKATFLRSGRSTGLS